MYADSQIIAQRNGGQAAAEYFYVTDRLGSVRQVVDNQGSVVLNYTYSPFGQMLEQGGSFDNSFLFTGQWFDSQFSQYYLRARQYDPVLMRFPARDPVFGKTRVPMTLHPYLYCLNGPINRIDPDGEFWGLPTWSKLQAKAAGVGLAARMGVDRFVTTLNLRAYWMEAKLAASESYQAAAWGMAQVHNLFANVAQYGNRAVMAVSQTVANWSNLTTYEEQTSFISGLLGPGSPGLPQDWAGTAGVAIHELATELGEEHEEYSDWYSGD